MPAVTTGKNWHSLHRTMVSMFLKGIVGVREKALREVYMWEIPLKQGSDHNVLYRDAHGHYRTRNEQETWQLDFRDIQVDDLRAEAVLGSRQVHETYIAAQHMAYFSKV
jgi:hypothetical protein